MTTRIIKALGIVAALGVSTMPLASYAADNATAEATVNVTINEAISMTIDQTNNSVTLDPNGSDTASIQHIVKVSTNAKGGYSLTLKDKDTDTNLTLSGTSFAIPTSDTAPDTGGKTWGVKNGTTWLAMPKSTETAISLKTAEALTGSTVYVNDSTTVTYGVAVDETLASGTYTDTVVYTATAN